MDLFFCFLLIKVQKTPRLRMEYMLSLGFISLSLVLFSSCAETDSTGGAVRCLCNFSVFKGFT